MPVMARLSKRFYDQFGEETTKELVDLLNIADQTYRTELREQNELNFARFDARLDQRIAELRSELVVGLSRVNTRIDRLGTELTAKIDHVATELTAKIDHVAAELNAKIDHVAAELTARIDHTSAELTARIDHTSAELDAKIDAKLSRASERQTRFLVVAWATLLVPILIGLWTRP